MSAEPTWLIGAVVQSIHRLQLAEHGGSDGIRDEGLLESALARPLSLHAYEPERATIPALAAAYGYGIASNHPFVDGNKRTAFVAMLTFLDLNGLEATASLEGRYLTMIQVAEGSMSEDDLARWIEQNTRARPD